MRDLMKELNNTIQSMNMSVRKIAKEINVSRTTISNGLDFKTGEMKFDVYEKLVHHVYKDPLKQINMIRSFIENCSTSMNVRKALSYSQVAGEYKVMESLIKRYSEKTKDKELKKVQNDVRKYLSVYNLYNYRNMDRKRGQELLDIIYETRVSSDSECQALLNTLLMAAEYDKQRYSAMSSYAEAAEAYIAKMDNGYVKDCLRMQYLERIAYTQLHANEVDKCRATCHEIINSELNFTVVKATAYCCLGESYIFENPLMAEKYILKAIQCLEGTGSPKGTQKYSSFKTTLAFLYIEFGFNLSNIDFDFISDGDLAYYECLYGDKQNGYRIFERLKEKGLSAFQMYYLSRIENDTMMARKSLEEFEKTGSLIYAQLPKRILITEGVL
ncbi:helix-turn-helix domain-containing protein [Bacillus tropicus]|uniref:Helix-turn-helix domain-containing protein n=1 Tax=Bacillus tropicus TaxID=2026188 RepID=A0A7T2QGN3_9BACI|nr:AimR family lysis-lysogeny pheromone receptor [Bacillus tropicus]AJG94274.1 putative prophage helix-turn-helix protein [Bacillus cereus]QPR78422.1 helix-turn-helix domain-containing protein [Bacillus tropicus]